MRVLAVVAQALAVVRRQHDQRPPVQAALAQPAGQAAHDVVGVGDLGDVGLPVAGGERLRSVVGRVRIVEVDPCEELAVLDALQPAEGVVHHLVPPLLDRAQRHHLELAELEPVGILVEALPQPPSRLQHPGSHECARRPAGLLEAFRQRDALLGHEEAAVVAHSVMRRHQSRVHGGVRGQSERHGGGGALEQHALPGQRVDVRGVHPREPVGAESVGTRGVERDDDDVEVAGGGLQGRDEAPCLRVVARRPLRPPSPARHARGDEHGQADHGEGGARATATARHSVRRRRGRRA
jgi:hypothetical protein